MEHIQIKRYILKYNAEHHMVWTPPVNGAISLTFSGGDVPKTREGRKNRLFVETVLYLHIFS